MAGLAGTGFSRGGTAAVFPALQDSSHCVQKPGPAWLWLFLAQKPGSSSPSRSVFIYSSVFLSKDLVSGGKFPSVYETSTD